MKKPKRRQEDARESDNLKRKLMDDPDPTALAELEKTVSYGGRGKHKKHPRAFGLKPEAQQSNDRTTCDGDAGFRPKDIADVQRLIRRGIRAGLVGHHRMRVLWAVGDDGWVYEARITNSGQAQYHGYPVRVDDPIAESIIRRYVTWANVTKEQTNLAAARAVCARYAIRIEVEKSGD